MGLDIKHFKEKLDTEKVLLVDEIEGLGFEDIADSDRWQANPSDVDALPSESLEVAKKIENFKEEEAIESELEIRLKKDFSWIPRPYKVVKNPRQNNQSPNIKHQTNINTQKPISKPIFIIDHIV